MLICNLLFMDDVPSVTYISCKSCNKALLDLDELIMMFEYIRNHDANHFKIVTITELVAHYENECDKFKENTSHEEAERLVRYSFSNLLDEGKQLFTLFEVNKETLDYMHYRLRST